MDDRVICVGAFAPVVVRAVLPAVCVDGHGGLGAPVVLGEDDGQAVAV